MASTRLLWGVRLLLALLIAHLFVSFVVLVTDDTFDRLPMISEYYKLSRGAAFVSAGFFVFVGVVSLVSLVCFAAGEYQDMRTLVLPGNLGSAKIKATEKNVRAMHLIGSLFLACFMLLVRLSQLPHHPLAHFVGCTGVQLALMASLFVYTIHVMDTQTPGVCQSSQVLLQWKNRPTWTILTLFYMLGPLSIFLGFLFKSRDSLFYSSWDVDDLYNSFSSLAEYVWALAVIVIWVKSVAHVLLASLPIAEELV